VASAEKMSDFIEATRGYDEEAFLEEHPYPFLIREATRGRVPIQEGRGTARLKRKAMPTTGDGFMEAEQWIHRVFPRAEDAESVRVGRDEECDLQIGDGSISAVHAEFSLDVAGEEKRFLLADLGSANGTFLNGDRIEPNTPVEISDMDSIRLGPVVKLQFFTSDGFFQFISMFRRIKKPS
jgi:hypothetical protein